MNTTFPTVEEQLFREAYNFDFFQTIRLLERLYPDRAPIGRGGPPITELVRMRALMSFSFPASTLYELTRFAEDRPVTMTVTFMGLTGPSGVLPRHYTELLFRVDREAKHEEKQALRDWFDMFNHRMISLFYRAWEKYRFHILYERGEAFRAEPDSFTTALFSYMGLGTDKLRGRLRTSLLVPGEEGFQERRLAHIDDLALIYYAGFLSHRPRCAIALQSLLQDYFQMPVELCQFQGQWLYLDTDNQSRLGGDESNNCLGLNVVAGTRIWDVQGKFRIRLGPLRYAQFCEFLPDRSPSSERKTFFMLSHLVRLYVGVELGFDIQLILKKEEIPACRLTPDGVGPRLGWNTWSCSAPPTKDAEEAIFDGEELVWVNGPPPRTQHD